MSETNANQFRIVRGFKVLTITPLYSNNAASILEALNNGTANVEHGDINVHHAPPAEGFYTIGKVVATEDKTPPVGPWTLFEEPVVHEHDGSCCKPLTKAEEERNEASRMAQTAFQYISAADVDLGRQLVGVAASLFDRHGDRNNTQGMWLTTVEGAILDAEGKMDEALVKFRAAVDQATNANGEGHPSVLITQANLGETLCKVGQLDEGKALLSASLAALQTATPTDDFDQVYIDGAVTNFTETLAKFQ